MLSFIRTALIALAAYFGVTYYLDEPEALKSDVAALHEMTDNLPEVRDRVVDGAKGAADKGGKKIVEAKNRLDNVKGRVQDKIAQGADRFSGGN
jgi:hypothetical protein